MPDIPLPAGAISTNSATTLAEVLARPDIWRGGTLASAPKPGVPTGFAALDAELPGGGWPRGALVELMARHRGVGEMSLLMPALTAQFSGTHHGSIVFIAPPLLPFAPGWITCLQRLMVIRARGNDAAWACARTLDTEGIAAVLAWLPDSRVATIRRLQLLAERSDALVFVFRPCACATQSSPAPLRLMLDKGVPSSGHFRPIGPPVPSALTGTTLAVHLIKRRGAGRAAPLYLNVPRPRRWSHAIPNSLPAVGNPMPLPQANSHVVAESAISAISA